MSIAAPTGSEPSPSSTLKPRNAARFLAMLPPGVCNFEGTEIPYALSSMKNNSGNRSVVTILSAAQKPLVAVDASPPWTTAMLSAHSVSPRVE
jgi:hypothetical protein